MLIPESVFVSGYLAVAVIYRKESFADAIHISRHRPDMDAVRCFDLSWLLIHHNNIFFVIYCKNSNTVTSMICNGNMFVIREDHKIFRIITTDRKSKFLGQKAGFLVYRIHGYCVLTCSCAEKIFAIRRKRHT